MKKQLPVILFLLMILICINSVNAQKNLTFPDASQEAFVKQRIGLTDISINYHSPQVNKRKVWGGIVPYNQVWRAGANQNTTITFTHDVTIEGKPLSPGTYGLHIIPNEKEWIIIFSKNSTSWGSVFYNKEEDALRVTVKPEKASQYKEWLTYEFSERGKNTAKLELQWEELRVPFTVNVNVKKVVIENMQNELRGYAGFTWEGPYQAAYYCIQNDTNLAQAMKWLDRSIATAPHFSNIQLKANVLAKQGKQKEADELMQKALAVANEAEINFYGYQLLNQKKTKDAILVFQKNINLFPDSWNAYDSMAECNEACGDKKQAIRNYKLALAKAPEDQKKRISEVIKKLVSN